MNFKTGKLRFIVNIWCNLWFALVGFTSIAHSQNCSTPFNIKFDNRTTSSISLTWSDINNNPVGWEIEVIIKGQSRSGVPNLPMLIQKSTIINNLLPSTAYELYIRTVCNNGKYSNWNVAIPFTTVLEIPSACKINIPLKDNGTEILLLDVPQKGILGKDIFFQSIDLIIEHDWPADMGITLESPQGQRLLLSGHNGTITDDFGDVNGLECNRVTTFSADACVGLKSSKPPYIGTFKPDGDITVWRQDTLSKGYWKLIIYDRALKDVGTLKYIDIKFNKEKCLVPQNFKITQTKLNSIGVSWDYVAPCNTVKFYIFENGIPTDTLFVQCNEGHFTFENLLPNTSYEFVITSICNTASFSQESCKIKASTTCESVSISESFDQQLLCKEGCASFCNIKGPVWFNIDVDSQQDWIVWSGKTDTENTGPSADINGSGKYIYIENNPQLCASNNEIILQSTCMQIESNDSGCDLSFYYHLYGNDITSLTLELSLNNGQNWFEIIKISGNQGDVWKRATVSLSQFQGKAGIFRFKTYSGNGPLSDIALDQIEFYKSVPKAGLDVYYLDTDGDGYGNDLEKIVICSSQTPTGYVTLSGDCNDSNPSIHPGVTEIPCNNVDENCNGLEDDKPQFNPIIITATLKHTSCNGAKDGKITLDISGGQKPYQINWQNGMTGEIIENLTEGVYFAVITDAFGCITRSSYFQIDATSNLNVLVTDIIQPSCTGKTDGAITIGHNTDNPPYQYQWSNGDTSKNLMNITEGKYIVTVTDKNNCFAVLSETFVKAKPSLLVGIKSVRHPFCSDQNNGFIELVTVNGKMPYSFKWANGESTDKIIGLKAGIYFCTITDGNGCINEFSTTISDPLPIEIKIVSTESARCFGESNGVIKTDASGGTAPYTFLWSLQADRTDDIFNLAAGDYILTVTDANGCKKTTSPIKVTQPSLFEIRIDSINSAKCLLGKNGYVSLNATGGNGEYNFVWKHTNQSSPTFNNLVSGNYSVTSYDKLGCKASIPNIFIPFKNELLDISISLLKDNLCFHDTTGQITASLTTGKLPFDFNWSHGLQYFRNLKMDTIQNLSAGVYQLTVTDADGCTGISQSISLDEKSPYSYSVIDITNNYCPNDIKGEINLKVNGGTLPIGIIWNGGIYSGSLITNLPNGTYNAQIIDANNCKLQVSPVVIDSDINIILNQIVTNNVNNASTGSICISPTGGLSTNIIKWSTGVNNQLCLENLSGGTYTVTVTDDNECSIEAAFVVENITSLPETEKINLLIYPNPFDNSIHITSETKLDELRIYKTDGQLMIQNKNIDSADFNVQTFDLPSGIYILELSNAKHLFLRKLVKN